MPGERLEIRHPATVSARTLSIGKSLGRFLLLLRHFSRSRGLRALGRVLCWRWPLAVLALCVLAWHSLLSVFTHRSPSLKQTASPSFSRSLHLAVGRGSAEYAEAAAVESYSSSSGSRGGEEDEGKGVGCRARALRVCVCVCCASVLVVAMEAAGPVLVLLLFALCSAVGDVTATGDSGELTVGVVPKVR